MKRVAFIINRMNFKPSSGHGIFMKGVVDTLLDKGHYIDIISDGEPDENFLKKYPLNFYYPDKVDRLGYTKHNYLFQFEDSFNFEKAINFRAAITKALSNHIYDLIICNDTESAFVCYQMELYKNIKIASYAHECASINPELKEGVFKDCYYNLIEQMMYFPITTLIQTEQNKSKILPGLPYDNPNLYVQPYPLTDSNVIDSLTKDGLLYIGRHEERKNPGAYVKVLADIKAKYGVELKAVVMTREAHAKKFEADFESIGHTNYEIKTDIVGDEKARLIQSAKVAFMPYKNESFGIAVLEALRFMPTVVLDKFDWHYNFRGMSNLTVANSKDVADVIWDLYNNFKVDVQKVEAEFTEYQTKYETALLALLEESITSTNKQEPRNRLYNKLKEVQGTYLSLSEYFRTENSKGVIYLTSDIETQYAMRPFIQIKQTNTETLLGIPDANGNLVEKENTNTSKESEVFSSFFG
jgi:glycosyltransferase involved in cell wall biosynthesis